MAHIVPLDPHRPIRKRKKDHENFKNAQVDTAIPHDAIQERATPNGHRLIHEQGIQIGQDLPLDETQIESSNCKRKNGEKEQGVDQDGTEPSERFCNLISTSLPPGRKARYRKHS